MSAEKVIDGMPLVNQRKATNKTVQFLKDVWIDAVALLVVSIVYVVPFIFIFLTASKTRQEASLFQFSWPSKFQLLENLREVMTFGDNRMFLALWNSTVLTVGSVTLIVLFSALVAYVLQRRQDRVASLVSYHSVGAYYSSVCGADNLLAAVDWPLQDAPGADYG